MSAVTLSPSSSSGALRARMGEAPSQLPVGAVVAGRYRLIRHLGRGAMGQVYEARPLPFGRPVALKVMHPHLVGLPEASERFRREAAAARRARSAHAVEVLGDGTLPDGRAYLAMELVRGQTLAERVAAQGPLGWERARRLAAALCDALEVAHEHGVIHRDLKPSNVLLAPGDVVKLTDFGLAKLARDEDGARTAALTGEGARVGSLHYMSPEQASGRRTVDRRADIFSIGCVLHFALTGSPPFAQRTLVRAGHDPSALSAPRLCARRPELPREVDGLLACCLAADPNARFHSCAALRRALRSERRPAPRRRAWTRGAAFLTGLAGALVVGGALLWLLARLAGGAP